MKANRPAYLISTSTTNRTTDILSQYSNLLLPFSNKEKNLVDKKGPLSFFISEGEEEGGTVQIESDRREILQK